jgi:hypothetical protein
MNLLFEHDSRPGTIYENRLIINGCGAILNEMDLHETVNGSNLMIFRGKFQEADAVNKNRRTYPFAALDANVKKLAECIAAGGLLGELDHPQDSIVHFTNASHKITKLWWEGKVLMGEGQILNTPSGKILKALINDGVRVGISSRGVGNGKVNEEGILVIGENYKLITFDAVADPSTHEAFQEKVSTAKREHAVVEENPQKNPEFSTKNENKGIHTNISKELILAVVRGMINK